jgi:hypothetical protein
MTRFFITFSLLIVLLVCKTSPAQAVMDPPLFSCLQPIGTLTSSYSIGVHGIPGDGRTYSGSDRVFSIDQSHVLQCFCPSDSSNGIQSNWWRVNELTPEDQDFFIRRGWVFVPNGQPWGLAESPYLVKNDSFQCQESGRGGQGGGDSSTTSTTDGSTSTADQKANRGGSILGISSLANTGSAQKIMLLYGVGILSALLAYRLGKG